MDIPFLNKMMDNLKEAYAILISQINPEYKDDIEGAKEFVTSTFNFPPITFYNPTEEDLDFFGDDFDYSGRYLTLYDSASPLFFNSLSKEQLEEAKDKGFVVIIGKPEEFENGKRSKAELFLTLLHEHIHANRNVLVTDYFRDDGMDSIENSIAYTYNDDTLRRNTNQIATRQGDIAQDFIKSNNIDYHKKAKDFQNKNDISKITDQMGIQNMIDEVMVELIAYLSFFMQQNGKKNLSTDIFDNLKDISKDEGLLNDKYNINSFLIAKFAQKMYEEKDLTLIKSMFQMDYGVASLEDIHYDYYQDYFTKSEYEKLKKFYKIKKEIEEKENFKDYNDLDR